MTFLYVTQAIKRRKLRTVKGATGTSRATTCGLRTPPPRWSLDQDCHCSNAVAEGGTCAASADSSSTSGAGAEDAAQPAMRVCRCDMANYGFEVRWLNMLDFGGLSVFCRLRMAEDRTVPAISEALVATSCSFGTARNANTGAFKRMELLGAIDGDRIVRSKTFHFRPAPYPALHERRLVRSIAHFSCITGLHLCKSQDVPEQNEPTHCQHRTKAAHGVFSRPR